MYADSCILVRNMCTVYIMLASWCTILFENPVIIQQRNYSPLMQPVNGQCHTMATLPVAMRPGTISC